MKYEDQSWSFMGLPGFTAISEAHTMAVDPDGIPYVAYGDGDEGNKISVKKFEDFTTNIFEVKQADYALKIYPNPNDGQFTLGFNVITDEVCWLVLIRFCRTWHALD